MPQVLYKPPAAGIGTLTKATEDAAMKRSRSDLEMNAVFDPRIGLLKELRDAHSARRDAQWSTWQMDRSWSERVAVRTPIERVAVRGTRYEHFAWMLGVVAAGLPAVGIERGLL